MGNSSSKETAAKAFQWYLLGDYEESKKLYDEIILEAQKNGIQNADLHHDYALLLSNGLHKYDEADRHYLKAINYCKGDDRSHRNKKSNFCGNFAGSLRVQKKYDESEVYFKKALELNPDDVHHLSNYADFLREIGKYNESRIHFNKAVSMIEIAEMALNGKRKDGKRNSKRSSKLQHLSPDSSNNLLAANDISNNGKGRGRNSTKNRGSIYKRNSALDTKLTRVAVQESNAFTKKQVGKTYSNYALLLFSMKSYDESGKLYRKSIEIDEENQVRHYNYARLLYDTQQWNLAINHLEIALELSSNQSSTAYWLYGRILMEQNEFDKGILYLKNAVEIHRNNPLYRCDYILCLIEAKNYEQAVNEMQNYKKLKLQYSYFDLIYTYFIAKVQGKKDDAVKNFKILMNQIPDDHPTSINSKFIYYYYYAWFLQYVLNEYESAIKYYDIIIDQLRPKHALSAYHYSVCIISKWIKINNEKQKKKVDGAVQDIDLNDDEDDKKVCDQEQIKEYKHALRLIKKAKELNDTIPIIKEHYKHLIQKIQKVVHDESDEPSVDDFTVVYDDNNNQDEKKDDD